jgi:hypothetical protein
MENKLQNTSTIRTLSFYYFATHTFIRVYENDFDRSLQSLKRFWIGNVVSRYFDVRSFYEFMNIFLNNCADEKL